MGHIGWAPLPVEAWHGILDCTNKREKACMPTKCRTGKIELIGTEDCLYIDISTCNIKPKTLLPVMFWIGGYAYTHNMDCLLNPCLLVEEGIVFVKCSYRLGPFGFLSINDITAPGNCGLKDVVMALQWVQNNISSFGGDPNNVTIFGNSSGGAIVHFMMLSPMSRGLFHQAIIQSASALNNWALAKNPSLAVMGLAKVLGINTVDKIEIVAKLKELPSGEIMEAFRIMILGKWSNYESDVFDALFKPCIEEEFEGQPCFLSKSPHLILKSGNFNKVPLIIGSNNIEAYIFKYVRKDLLKLFGAYNENVNLLVPEELSGDANKCKDIGLQLMKFYLGDETLSEKTTDQYLQFLSDYYFSYYVNKTVRLHSQYASECPVYYYILNCAGEWCVPEQLEMFNSVGHSAELSYIFEMNVPDYKGSRDSILTRKRVVKMWTNFAKYRNPTPDEKDLLLHVTWDPVENSNKLNYLSIGSELTKGRNPFYERMQFWDDLHNEHIFLRALVHFTATGVRY
ncbi:Esterase FE4 [Eumeta japonica]|uniref:Carboxylic ester hydrolase n=1 Tax=Eumeta variegata TaxID=151549 RepID=A0A4C1U030_EUMVA|nr:Esterase FE4 [Eumeta japonica]